MNKKGLKLTASCNGIFTAQIKSFYNYGGPTTFSDPVIDGVVMGGGGGVRQACALTVRRTLRVLN